MSVPAVRLIEESADATGHSNPRGRDVSGRSRFRAVMGTITVSDSMVTGSLNGFYNLSGTFVSLGNSQVSGNGTETVGTITTIGGK